MTRKRKQSANHELPLTVVDAGDGQFEIENVEGTITDFRAHYFHVSGYFGPYDPHLFSAAPQLAAALKAMVAAAEQVRFTNLDGPLSQAKAAMIAAKIA